MPPLPPKWPPRGPGPALGNQAAIDGITGQQRSKATTAMMDQQNFEAPQPASADPAVALAEMLGQLPKPQAEKPARAKTSVAELAEHLGLKLGDQNTLTIRRIKRGKGYQLPSRQRHGRSATSRPFAGCTGWRCRRPIATCAIPPTPIRICRRSASMPPAGCNTAITPTGKRCASSARRTAWPSWSRRCRKSAATSRASVRATSRRANSRSRP